MPTANCKTRAQYKGLGANYKRSSIVNNKQLTYIYNPTIDVIIEGMMCRVWDGKRSNTQKTSGLCIAQVRGDEVLVGDNIGGTLESWSWRNISDVQQVWYIGTFEYAMQRIAEFNGVVEENMHEVSRILR